MNDDLYDHEEAEPHFDYNACEDLRIQAVYNRMVDELINGPITTNTDIDDYQCPHDWREVSMGEELCSECAICNAIDC